ncbi:MAG: Mn transporter [Candidatus Nephthysia bennettiae]|uniref:Nramp family divalent metal transporter n=1 Tax=Candidatus Nephthysia bennettiae TaxID=3127016 RepID=A0A934KD58_9BACT|nr:Nramp family divalent metal transporter [Candidatus Dormibacteraeota bacterium]MBJ7612371.1 Nramp family divalent metal transporter [Candidatus Dormibacteraeota bacterium]PZR90909.1 MAG: Mn transporter [Candidatus Dormibacteraeota bacterium]
MDRLLGRLRRFRRIFILLAVIGPGLITTNAGNDAGAIATYSQAGAEFGFRMLWILVLITISLAVVNEMASRMGVVTGKGLADLIRERFGVRGTTFAMLLLLVANAVTTMAEFAGVAAALQLFGIPKYASVPLVAIAIWLLITRGSYPVVERVLLAIGVVYLAYVVSGLVSHPAWGEVARQTVTPHPVFSVGYFLLAIGLIGTTIAPWMLFYLQSSVAEKGIPNEQLPYSRADAIAGALFADLVAFFIIIAAAVALFGRLTPDQLANMQAADYARALTPVVGKGAFILFGVGLLGASLLSAGVVPLSTAYTVTEAFGWERGVGQRLTDAPVFFGIFSGLIVIGALAVLIPGVPLVSMILLSQEINGLILAVILLFMIVLVNDRRIMGRYVNGRPANIVSGATVVLLVTLIGLFLFSAIPGSPLGG